MNKPVIKLNGGNPVSLCKKCSTITSYLKHNEDNEFVTLDGSEPKLYCNKCSDLVAAKKVMMTIKSCVTPEHLESAVNFSLIYLNEYQNIENYDKIVVLLNRKREEIGEV